MNKCAIFDLDGTLLNTIDTISYYGNNALLKYGFNKIDTERYKYLVGDGAEVLVKRMLLENGSEDAFTKVYKHYTEEYDKDVRYLTEPYCGIKELLSGLKELGFKIAVLSNKPHDAAVSCVKEYFGDIFDVVQGAYKDVPKKPDATLLKRVLGALDFDKDKTIYIGDTACDMKTGKGGELFTIGVLWGFRKEDELLNNGADLIVKEPSEILKYAEKLV